MSHIIPTKITLKKSGFIVEFEQTMNNNSFACKQIEAGGEARDEFRNALAALLPAVIEACCLDEDTWAESGHTSGVTLKREGRAIAGAVLSAQLHHDDGGVTNINTRYLNAEKLEDLDIMTLLDRLSKEAVLYVEGAPKQTDLFGNREVA